MSICEGDRRVDPAMAWDLVAAIVLQAVRDARRDPARYPDALPFVAEWVEDLGGRRITLEDLLAASKTLYRDGEEAA